MEAIQIFEKIQAYKEILEGLMLTHSKDDPDDVFIMEYTKKMIDKNQDLLNTIILEKKEFKEVERKRKI